MRDHIDGVPLKVRSLRELQEIESHEVVKVLPHALVVGEVDAVVEASKFEYDLDDLGLVLAREAVMRLPTENSLDALEDHLRTDRVLRRVRAGIEVDVLLRQDEDCLVRLDRLLLAVLVYLFNSLLNVAPHVGRVITVEVDELLGEHRLAINVVRIILVRHARVAVTGDRVEVVLVSLVSDEVDGLVHVDLGVLSLVVFLVTSEDSVVGDLHEINLHESALARLLQLVHHSVRHGSVLLADA